MSIKRLRQNLINIIPVKRWRTWLSYNYGWFPKNFVQPDVKISSIRKLKLGGNVYIGSGSASLHCEGGLTIGFNTKLGEGCFIMTTNHNYKSTTRIPYDNIGLMQSVEIGQNCRTSAHSIICPGVKIEDGAIDEREQAKKYCDIYNLDHEIIDMNWSDFEELTPEILKADGVPFHSIEVQLLKVAKYAKSQGLEKIIIGDSADYVFGGMDKLLTFDWNAEAFIKRYNYIEPSEVLKNPVDVKAEYNKYKKSDNTIDVWKLMNEDMLLESLNSYTNASKIAGIEYLDPYSYMKMAEPLDLNRICNGEPKYMVRGLFAKRYPTLGIPTKIPMPRAMNQWLKDYEVSRPEFIRLIKWV